MQIRLEPDRIRISWSEPYHGIVKLGADMESWVACYGFNELFIANFHGLRSFFANLVHPCNVQLRRCIVIITPMNQLQSNVVTVETLALQAVV